MNFKQALVWPLTVPYGAAARLRARAYRFGVLRPKRLDARVISVGNLTVGGTGKTPMVLWLAERLLATEHRVGILTRGYRGTPSPDGQTSDEVELFRRRFAARVPIGVGANRYRNGVELIERGVDWILLDDGFQHLQLARDADIVLIDATNPFGGGRLLPAGYMREPKSALARATVVVITRSTRAPAVEAAIGRETNVPIFYARPRLDRPEPVASSARPFEAGPNRWFVFCGIGNPLAFVKSLRESGLEIVGQRFFRDHHRYTQAELDDVTRKAQAAGAEGLVCTEKDLFNLADVKSYALQTAYCRMTLEVDRAEEFWREVETAVAISQSKRKG